MRQVIFLILAIITLVQCGNTGGLQLPEGVEDKSKYKYPPDVDIICSPADLECKDKDL